MFDSVLDRGQGPKSRFGVGATISVILHVGLFGLALWLSMQPKEAEEKDIEVTLKMAMAPPPPPPPPPPPASSSKPKTQQKKPKKPDQIVQPKEIPKEVPKETETTEEPSSEPTEQEVEGGVEGGVVGGQLGGTGTDVLPFGAGMTRPEKVSGPSAEYTREALEARVAGTMIVKCVITTEGRVERCRIIKPLPHMERAVLDALTSSRYKPVTFQGRPVQVDYTFTLNFKLPR
jgi:protein TonB